MPLNPIPGSSGFDILFGSDKADLMTAYQGNDAAFGGLGDDRIYGGSGDDYLFGAENDDRVFGGTGNDFVGGGDGNDLLFGGDGNDTLANQSGDDAMYGGLGDDELFGGFSNSGGTQLLFGGDGDDQLRFAQGQSGFADGGAGVDQMAIYWVDNVDTTPVTITLTGPLAGAVQGTTLIGFSGIEQLVAYTGVGDDTIFGGNLGDHIFADLGANRIFGLGGDDLIGYRSGAANLIDAGDGNDTIRIASSHQGPTLLVVNGTSATDGFGSTLLNAENFELLGGSLDDSALFGAGNDLFTGARGDDRADGSAGTDSLYGGSGNDLLNGGDDADRLRGGGNNDTLFGGNGDDTLDGWSGADILFGGGGADQFRLRAIDTSLTLLADFQSGTDSIAIEIGKTGAVIGAHGALDPSLFNIGAAVGGQAQFVYIDDFGPLSRLVYDFNGDTAGGALTFCQFTGTVALSAGDIFMI